MPAKKQFTAQTRSALQGSHRPTFAGGTEAPLPGGSRISVSVFVRRKEPITPMAVSGQPMTRAEFRRLHAADPAAIKAVQAFAAEFGLDAIADPVRRTVRLTGSAKAMQSAFGVTLRQRTMPDGSKVRVREGDILLPESLHAHVEAVLGLDTRPQAKPHFRVARPSAVSASFTPVQIAQIYGFPSNAATGQTIGLIELGGGYRTTDLAAYFKGLGVPAPTVTAVSVDGGKNAPGNANGADGEVMLDIEVAGGVAPGSKIAVYFAPNTDQGFLDAITTAVHDTVNKPTVLSISWGGPESGWTQQAMQAMDSTCQSAAALGITVTAAAGDNGSDDGVGDGGTHVDFPASSPHVLACGGTKLEASGSSVSSEVVWNEEASGDGATGGGISTVFPQPSYQSGIAATTSGRGVPDVAGDADPTTGYQVLVDGQQLVIGGTSAVAPLWAGLIALCNAAGKSAAGLAQAKLYPAEGSGFRDITSGNNGAFQAGAGWDACTGLGSPVGSGVLAALGKAGSASGSKGKHPPKKHGKPTASKAPAKSGRKAR